MKFQDATIAEIDQVLQESWKAFQVYRKTTLKQRADLMRAIAAELEATGDPLIQVAMQETNLPETRLRNERARTMFQLTSYAEACEAGHWLEARIDTAVPEKNEPDVRKLQVAVGPVVVFGASNFPFAYSTAGGDTASALAAGCSVVVKAHPAHAETSVMVYEAIKTAVEKCNMPANVFQHVNDEGFATGKALVQHPATAAVGFTGSFSGGKALYDYASERKTPIPVFYEMGSINTVIFFEDTLQKNADALVKMYAGSVTLGMGQFCTNPGLMIAVESKALNEFLENLSEEVAKFVPSKMLHEGIQNAYIEKQEKALSQKGVTLIKKSTYQANGIKTLPAIAAVSGETFLNNPTLYEEIFGPYSLMVKCKDINELKDVWQKVAGQLTTSLMGTDKDFTENKDLIAIAPSIAGRINFNNPPTGVEVCPS